MKRKSALTFFLGIGLILCSFCLVLVSQIRLQTGFRESERIVSMITQMLPEKTPGVPGIQPDPRMPALEIENKDYVAIVKIPAYGVTLPVADQWDSRGLTRSPARFAGSAYDHTLVIGGADHAEQFGFCSKIGHGTPVTVMDMTGAEFTYQVSDIDRAGHADAQWLTQADCDLTLFCRDAYSMEYVAVRCKFD